MTIVKSRRSVHAIGSTTVVITNNRFKDNLRQGIFLERSQAEIVGNLIGDTKPDQDGFHGQGINTNPGEAVIRKNTISGSWHFGIVGQAGSKLLDPTASLARNRITGTKKDRDNKNGIGLFAGEESKVTLNDVTITGSEDAGIWATDFAKVTLEKSTVRDNGFHGVYATLSASITIKQTTASNNIGTGIQLGATDLSGEAVQAEISENTVQKNGQCGVFVDGDIPSVTGQNNTISENAGGQLCGKTSTFPTGFGGGK
ncbi:MAG: right-handed parallel beta-helix repeat-containing protein [Candidatus Bipolaricaulia bacterium]